MMAMNPQITKSYARGDYKYMLSLMEKGSRYSFYLLYLISLPIILNAEYILNLWIKEVPQYAVLFVQLSLIVIMIDSISRPLVTAQNATGNVKKYQLIVGGLLLLNLPISFILLKIVVSPIVVMVVAIVIEVIAMIARILVMSHTISHFQPYVFFKKVSLHCFVISMISSLLPILALYFMDSTPTFSFLINMIICILSTLVVIWTLGCSQTERNLVISKIRIKIKNYKMK